MSAKYVLENEGEANRLEKQALLFNYRPDLELKNFHIKRHAHVLDAGCGSGVISRFLAKNNPSITIDAFDISAVRIKQAKYFCEMENIMNVHFKKSDLFQLPVADDYYDTVFNRFVLEHVSHPQKLVEEFFRVLKPNGNACIVDLDGILFNLHTQNSELNSMLEELKQRWPNDLFVGRKISQFMRLAGFVEITEEKQVMKFTNSVDLNAELSLTVERLEFCEPFIQHILGSKSTDRFFRLYCTEMIKDENNIYYDKYIVQGIKPTLYSQ